MQFFVKTFLLISVWILSSCALPREGWGGAVGDPGVSGVAASSRKDGGEMTLPQCLAMALERNESRPAAQAALAMAEAQYKQAMSAYWPHVNLQAGVSLRNDDLNFAMPGLSVPLQGLAINVPSMAIQTPVTMITLPANALGPGFPPQAVQVPVPSQTINLPGQTMSLPSMNIAVPEQNMELLDRTVAQAGLHAQWLLADGGGRRAQKEQAQAGLRAASEEVRRTSMEVSRDVTRYYYGSVLARRVLSVARDTHARMTTTLDFTESMYKAGSEKVLKTDYLRNKVLADTLEGMIRTLEGNRDLADCALTFAMGLDWNTRISPSELELPVAEPGSLEAFVSNAYEFSPDWRKLEAGLKAAESGVDIARSGRRPRVAFTGSLHAITTGNDGIGIATETNRNGWSVGVGVEIPLWDGHLGKNRVAEARAKLDAMRHRRLQLQQGLALQVKGSFIRMATAAGEFRSCAQALSSAKENRELSEQGFGAGMIEADDVFQSQLMEAIMEARWLKSAGDHLMARAELEYTVGRSLSEQLSSLN